MDGGLYHEDFSFTSGCRIEEKYYAAYAFYYPLAYLFVLQNGKMMYDGL